MLAADRVSGTDADRHNDISRNGSSGFGDNADSATADLSPSLINARIAAPLLWAIHIGCPKNCTHCYRRSGIQFNREATPARTHGEAAGWVPLPLSDRFYTPTLIRPDNKRRAAV